MKKKMAKSTRTRLQQCISLSICLTLLGVGGCKNFFTPINGTGSGSTVVNTGDYAYVASVNTANSASPIYTLSGFSVGTGTLTALSGFPLVLPFPPALTVVNPANTILYVAGADVIYGYTISASGGLTSILNANQTQALANANIVSMAISPDGQWLLALDASSSLAVVDEFQIGSNGLLTLEAGARYTLTGSAVIFPDNIAVSPDGNFVAVALGTGGDVLFSFVTSTGALAEVNQVNTESDSAADQAVAFDATSSILFVAQSGTGPGVTPFVIKNGGETLTAAAGAPFALGTGASSMLIDASGKYLYVGNKVNSTITGFSIGTGGVLGALSGSPYASGTSVSALGRDNSGKYILATASGGTPDVQMYSFDATAAGKLDIATDASTGDPTEPAGAVAIALTH